jgi:GDP-mannose 6-dehydrogenase
MKISVLGIGYVGTVALGCLAKFGHQVMGVDISEHKVGMLAKGQSPIVEAEIDELIAEGAKSGKLTATTSIADAIANTDISFIAVGTPSGPDGSVSMRAVDEVSASIGRELRHKSTPHIIVMRSTVPPGTAEERIIALLEKESGKRHGEGFHYFSNPEFLREGTSVRDFYAPPYTLIGARDGDNADVLRELYKPISGDVHVTSYRVAESVKYLANAYHAVKLAFANEGGAILAAMGVDARAAYKLFCLDTQLNVSPAYLTPGFAFGGSCLPKDIRSFLSLAKKANVQAPFLGQVLPSNIQIIEGVFERINSYGRQNVALFGLAFKSGTDDLRESPLVILAERLLGRGYPLRIFDRSVQIANLTGSNRAYIEKEIPHLERLLTADPQEALQSADLIVVGHVSKADRPALLAGLKGKTVLDLAGVPELREGTGFTYQGLCW